MTILLITLSVGLVTYACFLTYHDMRFIIKNMYKMPVSDVINMQLAIIFSLLLIIILILILSILFNYYLHTIQNSAPTLTLLNST